MKATTVLFAMIGFVALLSGHGLANPFSMLTDHYMKETLDEEYDTQMLALVEELGDEMRDFDVEDVAQVENCPSYICSYNPSTKTFVYSCLNLSYSAQTQLNLSEAQRIYWMVLCFQCQSKCTTSQIFTF